MHIREKEARNVERLYRWAAEWRLPGGCAERLVDEIYAEHPEVIAILQDRQVAATGRDKSEWRSMEKRIEADYASREVLFDGIYPCGDVVAFEARVRVCNKSGEERSWPFAAFFTFDDAGRIICDHTYMPDTPHRRLLDETAAASGGGDSG